jgi:TetR/AcrR family fatty acid metabolism transcriptional regulator
MARKPDYRKKDHIAKVSTQLFADKGYANTTIEQIARESGYAVGTIYLYYDSKEEILATILTEFVEQFVDNNLEQIDAIADPVERFRTVVKFYLKTTEENPERSWVLATELRKVIRADSSMYKGEMLKLLSPLSESLKKLQEGGFLKANVDLEQYTLMIHGAIETLTLFWNTDKDAFSLTDKFKEVSDMILFGVASPKAK